MSRALVIINGPADREKVARWAHGVPVGTRIEFKETKRSVPQNDRFYAMLTDIAAEMKKRGRDHDVAQWKTIFMAAFGLEVKFLPSLDQKTFIPLGHSSSDLSVKEMSDLMEWMAAWAAENGITLKDTNTAEPDSHHGSADDAGDPHPASTEAGGDDVPAIDPPASDHSEWLFNVTCMLWAATNFNGDIDVLKAQRKAAAASYPTDGISEKALAKAKAVFDRCATVVAGECPPDDGLSIIAGIIGAEEKAIAARAGKAGA